MTTSSEDHHQLVGDSYRDADIASKYDARRFQSLRGRFAADRDASLILKAMHERAPSKQARVLDVACGTGRISEAIVKEFPNLSACDASPEMIQVASEKPALAAVDFKVCDATELPYETDSFELVSAIRFLGHLDRDTCQSVLSELARVATHGVVFDLSIKNAVTDARRVIEHKARGSYLGFETEWSWRVYTADEAKSLIRAAGLEVKQERRKLPLWSDAHIFAAVPR